MGELGDVLPCNAVGSTRARALVRGIRWLVAACSVLVGARSVWLPVDGGRRALRASALDVVHDVVQLARHPRGGLFSEVAQIARDLVGLVAGVELVLEPQLTEPRPAPARLDDEVGLADAPDGQLRFD